MKFYEFLTRFFRIVEDLESAGLALRSIFKKAKPMKPVKNEKWLVKRVSLWLCNLDLYGSFYGY
jgi:hypothetical protein